MAARRFRPTRVRHAMSQPVDSRARPGQASQSSDASPAEAAPHRAGQGEQRTSSFQQRPTRGWPQTPNSQPLYPLSGVRTVQRCATSPPGGRPSPGETLAAAPIRPRLSAPRLGRAHQIPIPAAVFRQPARRAPRHGRAAAGPASPSSIAAQLNSRPAQWPTSSIVAQPVSAGRHGRCRYRRPSGLLDHRACDRGGLGQKPAR